MDQPPATSVEIPVAASESVDAAQPVIEVREDGSTTIDILLPPPAPACVENEPDPFQNEIVVCRDVGNVHRLVHAVPGDAIEGSAIPRAEFKLSENATASADAEARAVGNTPANAAIVNVKVKFRP
ncbi:hypothetical protein P7228_00210 [Altererythrobacter arenosus]|uniref:Uncharacterized protein n=1 Tax=Altererythrobacter arenosus TaxID=3032592 RepID=A0ABY8FRN9_9SPHN|nr:hypothetical protein [Altererythrobacter sp. CAU 1644]WFL77522.1 hypothetical protein P7228_00210 [Altererythrobacter sp. CAU 1644]